MGNLFESEGRELFHKGVADYIELIAAKLAEDIKIPGKNGNIYTTKGNLLSATYSLQSFTDSEIDYFYKLYDKLWAMGARIEAYSLMRLIFGVMTKNNIETLYRQGHLFTTREVYNYARQGAKP